MFLRPAPRRALVILCLIAVAGCKTVNGGLAGDPGTYTLVEVNLDRSLAGNAGAIDRKSTRLNSSHRT